MNDTKDLTALSGASNRTLVQNLLNNGHVPDILDCIANLSSDEVFTPPEVVDKVLDLLPAEVWTNKELKWLDPACKTGIFLRQITKRLMEGLRQDFPDEEKRRQHIFNNMVYGIAITELTALMSRRSLYTSKDAGGDKSIAHFDNEIGHVIYDNRAHTYGKNGICTYCGNRKGDKLDRDESSERHAYNFIHLTPEEAKNMKFDVIVGNPPYQLSDGGFGASASPIYQLFVKQAKALKPRYMAFIIPSRWFAGGKGLDSFRDEMLSDRHIKAMVDYPDSSDCFPGVDIKGGVCYFVRDEQYSGPCNFSIYHGNEILSQSSRYLDAGNAGVLIRYPEMISILEKVRKKHEKTMDLTVSVQKPYGFRTDTVKDTRKYNLPRMYEHEKDVAGATIKIHGLLNGKRVIRYVPLDYPFPVNNPNLKLYKIFIPNAYGCGAIGEQLGTPILGTPLSACTETFLEIGGYGTEEEAKNMLAYLKTKFFRLLVGIKKTTQHTSRDTYSLVPQLDLHKEWTDEKLYKRYGLDKHEIKFIEDMIGEMK